MPSGGDQSPPPPPPPPAAAASDEEEEDDGEAEDAAQPARSPAPQTQQRFDELCSRLNMDEAARAEAWDSYRNMSESYTLEVRPGAEARGVPGLVVAPRRGDGPLPPGPGVLRDRRAGPGSPRVSAGLPGPRGPRAVPALPAPGTCFRKPPVAPRVNPASQLPPPGAGPSCGHGCGSTAPSLADGAGAAARPGAGAGAPAPGCAPAGSARGSAPPALRPCRTEPPGACLGPALALPWPCRRVRTANASFTSRAVFVCVA